MPTKRFDIPVLISVADCMDFCDFVQNKTIQRNVAYNLQYLDFLNKLYNEYIIDKSVEKSFIKNQIIILASILEAFLYSLLQSNDVDFGKDWKEEKENRKYITLDEGRRIKTVIEEERVSELTNKSSLWWMIEVAKNNNIFQKDFAESLHFIKEHRNRIHLASLNELEYKYFTPQKLKEAKNSVLAFLRNLSKKPETEIQKKFTFLY